MPLLEDPEDFIAVSVVGSEYAQKWSLEGSPFVYKLHASRYKKWIGTFKITLMIWRESATFRSWVVFEAQGLTEKDQQVGDVHGCADPLPFNFCCRKSADYAV